MRLKKKALLFLITSFFYFSTFLKVFALEVAWPPSPFGTRLTDGSSFTEVVKYFYEWGIAIGGIAVFISLLIGGFLYLTSAGDPARLREAKDRIISSFIGLVILLGSWLIVRTINPELVILRTPEVAIPPMEIPEIATSTFSTEPCDKAYVYGETDYAGVSATIEFNNSLQVNFHPKSVKIVRVVDSEEKVCGEEVGCNCVVKMYESSDCSGGVVYALSVSDKDITDVLPESEYDIKCIKVEKAF